jgi:hypothetical protein
VLQHKSLQVSNLLQLQGSQSLLKGSNQLLQQRSLQERNLLPSQAQPLVLCQMVLQVHSQVLTLMQAVCQRSKRHLLLWLLPVRNPSCTQINARALISAACQVPHLVLIQVWIQVCSPLRTQALIQALSSARLQREQTLWTQELSASERHNTCFQGSFQLPFPACSSKGAHFHAQSFKGSPDFKSKGAPDFQWSSVALFPVMHP